MENKKQRFRITVLNTGGEPQQGVILKVAGYSSEYISDEQGLIDFEQFTDNNYVRTANFYFPTDKNRTIKSLRLDEAAQDTIIRIDRPEDLRVRTVANKSKLKVSIIQSIDRKVALDDIAVAKGIEFGELLDEIEAIVYSGTKLNIDYFLEEIMDEDHMQDIYDYFKESVTDKIDDAMDELGDDYTEDEIRLVRIKFISEMAN